MNMKKRRSPVKSSTPLRTKKSKTEDGALTELRSEANMGDDEAQCSHSQQDHEASATPKTIGDLPREMLALIMKLLARPRDKLSFGSCCRQLKSVVDGRDAWTNINSLIVDFKPVGATKGSINDDLMSIDKVTEYVAPLLERITLKHLSMYKCFDPNTYRRCVGLVLRAAADGTVPLESLHISGQMDIGAPYVTVLVSVFSRSVRNMMIMESDLNAKQTLDMWQLVGDCKQLHRFTFLAGEPDEDRSDTDTVIDALQGKELRTLGLNGIKELSTDAVVRLVETLPQGLPTKLEVCYSENVSLSALSERLSAARRQCVLDFEFAFVDTFELDAIYSLPNTFPNMRSVDLDFWTMGQQTPFPTTVVRATIGKFLACAGRTTKINMLCESADLTDVLGGVLSEQLCDGVTKHQEPGGRTFFRISKDSAAVLFYYDNYTY